MKKFILWMGVIGIAYIALILVHVPKFDADKSIFITVCNTTNATEGSQFSAIDQYPGTYLTLVSGSGRNGQYAYTDPKGDVAAKLICSVFPQKLDNPLAMVQALSQTELDADHAAAPNYSIQLYTAATDPSVVQYVFEIFGLLAIWGFAFLVRQVGKK